MSMSSAVGTALSTSERRPRNGRASINSPSLAPGIGARQSDITARTLDAVSAMSPKANQTRLARSDQASRICERPDIFAWFYQEQKPVERAFAMKGQYPFELSD